MKNLMNIPGLRLGTFSKICGVYFLVYKNEIVYVGQSINIAQRLQSHKLYAKFKFDSLYYLETNKDDLLNVETAFIYYLKPKYNSINSIYIKLRNEEFYFNLAADIIKNGYNLKCNFTPQE